MPQQCSGAYMAASLALRLRVIPLIMITCIITATALRFVGGALVLPSGFLQLSSCHRVQTAAESDAVCNFCRNISLQAGPAVPWPTTTSLVGSRCTNDECDPQPLEDSNNSTSSIDVEGNCKSIGESSGSSPSAAPTLDLASLSLVFEVPPNGLVVINDLYIAGARLPNTTRALPAASFLALSAFRLAGGAGAVHPPLQLSNLVISTPSCTALAMHQSFACALSPSPNFTITPSSLIVHRFTTPTASITNVTLVCSGAPVRLPCMADKVSSGSQLTAAIHSISDQASVSLTAFGGVPLAGFLYLEQSLQLAHWTAPSTPILIRFMNLTICGAPDGATELDLANTADTVRIDITGFVQLLNLTIRNPPAGSLSSYPWGLFRSGLWTFSFSRRLLGRPRTNFLVRDVALLDVPPEEVAMYWDDMRPKVLPGVQDVPDTLPPAVAGCRCAYANSLFYGNANWVADADPHLAFTKAGTRSDGMLLLGVRVYPRLQGAPASGDSAPSCLRGPLCQMTPEGATDLPFPLRASGTTDGNVAIQNLGARDAVVQAAMATVATRLVTQLTAEAQVLFTAASVLMGDPYGTSVMDVHGYAAAAKLAGDGASFTVRHLTLVGLPPAGEGLPEPLPAPPPYVFLPMVAVDVGTARLQGQGRRSVLQQESGPPPPPGWDSSPTQGLSPALTNFTSCLWTMEFDRPAAAAGAAAAAAAATQPTSTAPSSASGAASASTTVVPGSNRPAGLPYVFLDSVTLVIPQAELELLTSAWERVNFNTTDLDPGLADQLGMMLAGSVLSQGSAVAAARSALTPTTSLTFERLWWCGLQGRNVTFTSQLPVIPGLEPPLQLPQQLGLPVVDAAAATREEQVPYMPPPLTPPPAAPPGSTPAPTAQPVSAAPGGQGSQGSQGGQGSPNLQLWGVSLLVGGLTFAVLITATGLVLRWWFRRHNDDDNDLGGVGKEAAACEEPVCSRRSSSRRVKGAGKQPPDLPLDVCWASGAYRQQPTSDQASAAAASAAAPGEGDQSVQSLVTITTLPAASCDAYGSSSSLLVTPAGTSAHIVIGVTGARVTPHARGIASDAVQKLGGNGSATRTGGSCSYSGLPEIEAAVGPGCALPASAPSMDLEVATQRPMG